MFHSKKDFQPGEADTGANRCCRRRLDVAGAVIENVTALGVVQAEKIRLCRFSVALK
jgi:hypothetical protein